MAEIIGLFGDPDPEQVEAVQRLCAAARIMRDLIYELCDEDCCESEQALFRLQEALMWANSAVIGEGDVE